MKKGRLLANAYLVLVFGFLYVPIAVLIAFSFNESKSRTVFTGFTFKWYQNLFHKRAYQDALKQQAFNNSVTSEKLNIAKGEWALKQSNAQAKASRAAGNAAAKSSGSGKASGSAAGTNALKGSSVVPFTAALLRSRGKSDTSIANALQKEGYTTSDEQWRCLYDSDQ